MRIGVLAVQGAFAEHIRRLWELGAQAFEIRKSSDLAAEMDGLILPGGESTVMGKLLDDLDLMIPLKSAIENGLPVFGTCAGMILLAGKIEGGEAPHFATMDMVVRRNAYGRQLGSFSCREPFAGKEIEMRFIRAPFVASAGKNVEVLARHQDKIIAVRQGKQLATAFHPELTGDPFVYQYFFEMIRC